MSDSPPMDYVIEWSTDGNTPNLGTIFSIYNAVITSFPTNYYARFTSVALNCTTSWSIPQFVVADPISQPTGISGGERCGNGNVTFTASIPSNPDEQIQWSLDGANIADIGTNYNVSVFSGNPKTIYVRVANTVTGCTTNFLSNPFIATADLCIDPFSSTTVAGFGTAGNVNGSGMGASFNGPMGLLYDANANRLLIADAQNHKIRSLNLGSGTVNTFTGSGTPGFEGGEYPGGSFNQPMKLVLDPNTASIYVVDRGNHAIRQLAFGGVNNFAGTGGAGFTNGTFAVASFNAPTSAVYLNDKLYVVDHSNHAIREIDLINETVSTLAGNGTPGFVNGSGGDARFNKPWGITTDGSMLYVTDYGNHAIRQVSLSGSVSTLAGNSTPGYVDGSTATARLKYPTGIVEKSGKLYFTDHGNHCVRELSAGIVSTLSGNGTPGTQEGPASTYLSPMDVVLVGADLYVVDAFSHTLRRLQP